MKLFNYLKTLTRTQYLFITVSIVGIVLIAILFSTYNNTIQDKKDANNSNKLLKALILKQDSIINHASKLNDTLVETTKVFESDRKIILNIVKENSKLYQSLKNEKEKIPNIVRSFPITDLQREVAAYNY